MKPSESAPASGLDGNESVELAAALTASIANQFHIRCLFIKGSAAVAAGMRPSRLSADTDVLVHPDDAELLLRKLSDRGWIERPFWEGIGNPKHSNTLYHPNWPCDIDVHFRFPGLDADPTDAFEALEKSAKVFTFANVPAFVPTRAGMLIIQITHALRNIDKEGNFSSSAKNDYEFLLNRNEVVPWEDLEPLLQGTMSWASMEKFLIEVYPEHASDLEYPQASSDWTNRTSTSFPGVRRFRIFIQLSMKNKIKFLKRIIFPSRLDLASQDLGLLTASSAELLRFRFSRLTMFIGRLRTALVRLFLNN